MLHQFLSENACENCPTLPPVIGQFFYAVIRSSSSGDPKTWFSYEAPHLSGGLLGNFHSSDPSLYDDFGVVEESPCSSFFVWLPWQYSQVQSRVRVRCTRNQTRSRFGSSSPV